MTAKATPAHVEVPTAVAVPHNETRSTKILMAVLGALWIAVSGSYFAQGSKMDGLVEEQYKTQTIATKALETTVRIEARLKTMDEAAVVRATADRDKSAARITELERELNSRPSSR